MEQSTYLAYGQTESDYRPDRWGAFREDYRFTGKEEDSELGLVYFGKRYLNAQLGRWMSFDPLTMHGLGADLNGYAYVSGRVLQAVDPLGLEGAEADAKKTAVANADAAVSQAEGGYADAKSQLDKFKKADHSGRSAGDVAGEREALQRQVSHWEKAVVGAREARKALDRPDKAPDLRGTCENKSSSSDCEGTPARGSRMKALGEMQVVDTADTWETGMAAATMFSPSTGLGPMAARPLVNLIPRADRFIRPSSRVLGTALERAGHVRPPSSTAHHIVAGRAKGAATARAVLERFGIGINDAANGAFLPSSIHARIHTKAYYKAVNDALLKVSTKEEALAALSSIRQSLIGGSFP